MKIDASTVKAVGKYLYRHLDGTTDIDISKGIEAQVWFEYITNNGVIYDFRIDITTYSNKLRVNLFETSVNPVKPISHKVYDEKTFVDINNGMYKVLSDIEKIITKKY